MVLKEAGSQYCTKLLKTKTVFSKAKKNYKDTLFSHIFSRGWEAMIEKLGKKKV